MVRSGERKRHGCVDQKGVVAAALKNFADNWRVGILSGAPDCRAPSRSGGRRYAYTRVGEAHAQAAMDFRPEV